MKNVKCLFLVTAIFTAVIAAGCAAKTASTPESYRPVFTVGGLMGAFDEKGVWRAAPEKVTVDGQSVSLSEIEKDKKVFAKLTEADGEGKGLPCETPMAAKGQKVVYFGPEGRKFEGVVKEATLRYAGEATGGARLDFEISGADIEADWSKLLVGVAEGVDAVPAPTVSEKDASGAAFSCDYGGVKHVASWKSDGGVFTAKLSVGGKSWGIGMEDGVDANPSGVEDIQCGFFDLDGNGSLEMVVYDSGPNGSVSLYRIDPEKGPAPLAWAYTGEE